MSAEIFVGKRNRKGIEAKENLLKESQSLSHTGSFRWDIKNGKVLWSEEEFHILGLDPLDTIPTFDLFRSMILIEDLPLFEDALAEAHKNIRPFHVDLRIEEKKMSVKSSGCVVKDARSTTIMEILFSCMAQLKILQSSVALSSL